MYSHNSWNKLNHLSTVSVAQISLLCVLMVVMETMGKQRGEPSMFCSVFTFNINGSDIMQDRIVQL